MQLRTIPFGLAGTLLLSLFTTMSFSQDRPASDTVTKPAVPSVVKPYKDVVTAKAITQHGFFKVHKIDDRYLFEIPKKLMERQILAQARISKGAVDPDLMASVPGGFGVHKTGNANEKHVVRQTEIPSLILAKTVASISSIGTKVNSSQYCFPN